MAIQTSIKEKLLYLLQGLQLNNEDSIRIKHCINAEDLSTAIMILRHNRGEMLDKLHTSQQALDDLDLLVYQIKKWENERMELK